MGDSPPGGGVGAGREVGGVEGSPPLWGSWGLICGSQGVWIALLGMVGGLHDCHPSKAASVGRGSPPAPPRVVGLTFLPHPEQKLREAPAAVLLFLLGKQDWPGSCFSPGP